MTNYIVLFTGDLMVQSRGAAARPAMFYDAGAMSASTTAAGATLTRTACTT